jgi:hypothetical protein
MTVGVPATFHRPYTAALICVVSCILTLNFLQSTLWLHSPHMHLQTTVSLKHVELVCQGNLILVLGTLYMLLFDASAAMKASHLLSLIFSSPLGIFVTTR